MGAFDYWSEDKEKGVEVDMKKEFYELRVTVFNSCSLIAPTALPVEYFDTIEEAKEMARKYISNFKDKISNAIIVKCEFVEDIAARKESKMNSDRWILITDYLIYLHLKIKQLKGEIKEDELRLIDNYENKKYPEFKDTKSENLEIFEWIEEELK